MFKAKTEKIEKIASKFPHRIEELERIFDKPTNIYIDYANILSWYEKLKFHVDIKRFKQFFNCFENVKNIYFYYGTLEWDEDSENLIKHVTNTWYILKTKPVKIMKKSIDISSIEKTSSSILENFIRKPLLKEFTISTIEYLNDRLSELNQLWKLYIEDRKCNFDVEIWNQMFEDMRFWEINNFILLSWDSDFHDIITQLHVNSNKVFIFATSWKISRELSESNAKIYDLKKIRNFICFNKEIEKWVL